MPSSLPCLKGMPAYQADRYRSATVDNTGAFQFRGLPAGQYNVYAWIDVDDGAWFNPAFLRSYDAYRRSLPVTDGQNRPSWLLQHRVVPLIYAVLFAIAFVVVGKMNQRKARQLQQKINELRQ
jgi:hypothetical protein